MKKLTALILAALLSTAAVSATNLTPSAPVPVATTSRQKEMPSLFAKGSAFLTDPISLPESNYVPYSPDLSQLPETEKLPDTMQQLLHKFPMGQLQKQQDGFYATAMVYHWSYPVPAKGEADPLRNLFSDKKSSDASLSSFNQMLTLAEPFGNALIKSYISSMNQKNKNPVPENIFSFSLRNTTPAASFNKKGYTFGTRIITKADGWTLPFYLKSYVWKKGNTYYILAALCADSEWDMLDSDMDALAEKAMK